MNLLRPTLAELRTCVQKDRHREIGNWLARNLARPAAVYGCWLAIRLGLSAHQVTLAALLANVGAALAIGSGERAFFVLGVILSHLAFWLDHVDGQVARWRGTASLDGVYFDYLMHHAAGLVLGFGLGYGLAARSGDIRWTILGFLIATGWTFLNLHNDCRYKAFFQRFKTVNGRFQVEGGGGGRPQPPQPWPRRGREALTWPAFKACEPHVVLLVLTALALAAMVVPDVWLRCWRIAVVVWAVVGPGLGIARIARSLVQHKVECEFSLWFQPIESGVTRPDVRPPIHDAAPWT
jgi:CDP-alcohol phosphatidyltransferase